LDAGVVESDDFALYYTQYRPNFTSLVIVLNLIIYGTISATSGREASIIQCYALYSHGRYKTKIVIERHKL